MCARCAFMPFLFTCWCVFHLQGFPVLLLSKTDMRSSEREGVSRFSLEQTRCRILRSVREFPGFILTKTGVVGAEVGV